MTNFKNVLSPVLYRYNLGQEFARVSEFSHEFFDDEMIAFGELMERVKCLKICKEEHPFNEVFTSDQNPPEYVLQDFENKLPYNYLQFAYFKVGQVKKACQAAMTFFNSGNEEAKNSWNNLKFYLSTKGGNVTEEDCQDLELPDYRGNCKNCLNLL